MSPFLRDFLRRVTTLFYGCHCLVVASVCPFTCFFETLSLCLKIFLRLFFALLRERWSRLSNAGPHTHPVPHPSHLAHRSRISHPSRITPIRYHIHPVSHPSRSIIITTEKQAHIRTPWNLSLKKIQALDQQGLVRIPFIIERCLKKLF